MTSKLDSSFDKIHQLDVRLSVVESNFVTAERLAEAINDVANAQISHVRWMISVGIGIAILAVAAISLLFQVLR